MGLDISLEADARLTNARLAKVVKEVGGHIIEQEDDELRAAFHSSGLSLVASGDRGSTAIMAEEPMGATFSVGCRAWLRINPPEYDACMIDLKNLLDLIARDVGSFFVVSFQLETTLFTHLGQGVQVHA